MLADASPEQLTSQIKFPFPELKPSFLSWSGYQNPENELILSGCARILSSRMYSKS